MAEADDIGDAVYHNTNDVPDDIEDDDDGFGVTGRGAELEVNPQIHDGHDQATQVHNATEERRRNGNAGDGLVASDFPDYSGPTI